MSENPYQPPSAPVSDPANKDLATVGIAKAQRLLLMSILVSTAGNVLMRNQSLPAIVVLFVAVAVAAFSIWCVYRLCEALELSPALWIVAMFVPVVNLICLLVLNQKATAHLKARGIQVGLLGARI